MKGSMRDPKAALRGVFCWISARRARSAAFPKEEETDETIDRVAACGRKVAALDNEAFPRSRRLQGERPNWPGPSLDNF